MGGGDLNLKKSWHPSTLRNIERVWKAEQKHEAEQQKIEQLQKELAAERAREEIQTYAEDQGVVRKREQRLDWMYQGPAAFVDREDYLLGRKIDKTLELLESQENGKESERREEEEARSVFHPSSTMSDATVDLANKIKEDPLFAIMKREKEERKTLLNNPVRMKQLKAMLTKSLSKSKKSKKSKKKKSKKAKYSESESETSSDSESDFNERFNKQKQSDKRKRVDEDYDDDSYNRKKHRDVSSKANDFREKSYRNKDYKEPNRNQDYNEPYRNRDYKEPYRNQDYKEPYRNQDYKEPYRNQDYKEPHRNQDYKEPHRNQDYKEPYRNQDYKEPHRNQDNYNSSNSRYKDQSRYRDQNRYRDESQYKDENRYKENEINKKDQYKNGNYNKYEKPESKRKLTSEEKERLRKEMMDNAKWRDTQRKENVKRYKDENDREEKATKGKASDFIKPMLSKAAEYGTVENRVKQKIFTIQRKTSDMNSHFARR